MAAVLSSIRPSAEDLWETAVAKLSERDKAILNLDLTNRLDAIAKSLELAHNAADICKKKAWRFKRKNGGEVIARDVFAKVARWISHFKAVGDAAAQYNTTYAAIPWAGVRFVLQVCVDYFETHDFLLEKISQIAEQICRCELIEQHLILQFLRTLKRVSAQFDEAFQAIVTAQTDMERCFQMAKTQDQLDSLIALKDDLSRLEKPMARWSNEMAKITDGLDRSRRTEILRWISSEPYAQYHKRERETFLEGTGKWLISHPVFQKWKDDSASSLLWLHGIPGSGKSKLTSLVIEDAMEAFRKQQAPSPAYFYCSRNPAEPGRSDPRKILASIVRQFSSPGPGKPLLQPTIIAYESQEAEGFPDDSLPLGDSYDLLLEILDDYPTAIIIIDALDECHPETRQKLLDKLEDILRKSPTLVKIFVSSREDQDIKYNLRDYPALELSSDLNTDDIDRFVECETRLLIKQGKLLQSSNRKGELTQEIIQKVSNGADGMFRWASLQLAALCDLVTDKAILERLGRLPPTLGELYQETLNKIQQYSAKADRVYAENALAWLLCSRKRLNSYQFLVAVSTTDRLSEPLTKDQVLRLCCNLVIFDSTIDGFRFAHLSVREFLEDQSAYCISTINSIAARFCLTTLLTCNTTVQRSGLRSYASFYWAPHCEDAADQRESGPLQTLLGEFLFNTTPQSPFNAWSQYEMICVDDFDLFWKLEDIQEHGPCVLAVASIFNFAEVAKSKIQKIDLSEWQACARLSASHGAIRTLEVFLDSNEYMVTEPMVVAAARNTQNGKEVMALLLQKRGDQIAITDSVVNTAAGNPNSEIMDLLLQERGDRIEITDTVIEMATKNENLEVMALLLEKKGDQIEMGYLVELAASSSTSELMTLILEKRGDQIQITEEMVKIAAGNRNSEILALLLEMASRVSITEEAVKVAAGNRNSEILALLLEMASQVRITEEAVKVAANNWNSEIMALLLEKGCQVEITEEVVKIAADSPNRDIMALLIEKGGQVVFTDEVFKIAADNPNSEVMALLLGEGRRVEITGEVVKVAAGNPNSEIMAVLLDKGGQVAITEEVVKAAASNRNNEVMVLLLEKCSQLEITEEVVSIAARHWFYNDLAWLLEKKRNAKSRILEN
ncbi:hypothetical protein F5Y10DRAFT_264070 [Nemania abortiva]|nr:hypothetical protein F5Y10DRAFT_264070 [Nemania abortiva]